MDRAALDAAYNNSAAVADSATRMAGYRVRSDRLRAAHGAHLDLRYGPAERNRIDYLAADTPGPVLVFVHGGYWQMRAKEDFSFLAGGLLAHGFHAAFVGYTLAPEKRLGDIVVEVQSALAWLVDRVAGFGGDPARIFVSGWSAGGHLATMTLDAPFIKGGLAISGIYDLEPMRLCYINDKLQLDSDEADRLSPMHHLPARSAPLIVAFGGDELPELRRQSEAFAAARARVGLTGRLACIPGHNHFTILDELANPDGALTALVRELAAL
jgi:arylformamidase